MTKIQGLSEDDECFVVSTIKRFFPHSEIILFGSRQAGTQKKYSDIDLCIKNEKTLSLSAWSHMEEVFAESDLPFLVDISDFHLLTEDFQKHVLETGIRLA